MKMKKKKNMTTHNFYAPWEYEKEEFDLDEKSKKGLQLKKGGCFKSKFYKDENVRYIYQLDYNPKIEDPLQYRESFEEQGWQFINSTFNGWHYFRKLYVEGMAESEMKIYTDKQSLYEMQGRWMRLIGIVTILYFIMAIAYLIMGVLSKETTILIEGIIFVVLFLTFGMGIISVNRRRNGKTAGFVPPVKPVFLLTFATLFVIMGMLFFGFYHATIHEENFTLVNLADENTPWSGGTFTVDRKGTYELNLDFSDEGGAMTVVIQDINGSVVYKNNADSCRVDGWELKLEKGTYQTFYTFTFDEGSTESQVKVDMEINK